MLTQVKYWPVDAYFDHFEEHAEHMLRNRILLNDILFFIQLG